MSNWRDQFRQVMRRLARAPMFTAITLVTLAVSIGANAAIFSVVEGVLLKPLPYPHSDELVGLWHVAPGLKAGDFNLNMSPSMYFIYREQNRSFTDIGLYHTNTVTLTGVAEPEQLRALEVTDGTLPILGVTPALGRFPQRRADRHPVLRLLADEIRQEPRRDRPESDH
jgi:hypothetical protein